MPWVKPEFSKAEVNEAGRIIIDDSLDTILYAGPIAPGSEGWAAWERYERALTIVNNWRSCHSYPLNVFVMTLRNRVAEIDTKALVSQRIKRLPAIDFKLRHLPHMTLWAMQDIGGCRAVVRSVRGVYRLLKLYEQRPTKHVLRRTTDYIKNPRSSGYRSLHLIYRYRRAQGSPYDGFQIEIQIRSQLQHTWATAVETVGIFLRQALKSSHGEEGWLRFFALVGTAMAQNEKTPAVPGTPTNRRELVKELKNVMEELNVRSRLRAYSLAVRTVGTAPRKERGKASYYLLRLNVNTMELEVQGFGEEQLEEAMRQYVRIEKEITGKAGIDAVLVSVMSLNALRRAYPSYFFDTHRFLLAVDDVLRG